jgi:hypothetical protein
MFINFWSLDLWVEPTLFLAPTCWSCNDYGTCCGSSYRDQKVYSSPVADFRIHLQTQRSGWDLGWIGLIPSQRLLPIRTSKRLNYTHQLQKQAWIQVSNCKGLTPVEGKERDAAGWVPWTGEGTILGVEGKERDAEGWVSQRGGHNTRGRRKIQVYQVRLEARFIVLGLPEPDNN